MKKIYCLLLCFVLLFTFVSCKKERQDTDSGSIDIEYYAKLGKIPECDAKLGDSVDELCEKLSAENQKALDAGEEYLFTTTEGEKSVEINNGENRYYYEKGKKENGISYIVAFGGAYGFEAGSSVLDVKKALSAYKFTEEDATEDNVFFILGMQNGTVLSCDFENNVVMFVFEENQLSAVAIYDTDNWTL